MTSPSTKMTTSNPKMIPNTAVSQWLPSLSPVYQICVCMCRVSRAKQDERVCVRLYVCMYVCMYVCVRERERERERERQLRALTSREKHTPHDSHSEEPSILCLPPGHSVHKVAPDSLETKFLRHGVHDSWLGESLKVPALQLKHSNASSVSL